MSKIAGIFKKRNINNDVYDELISLAEQKGVEDDTYLISYLKDSKKTQSFTSFGTKKIFREVIIRVMKHSINAKAGIDFAEKLYSTMAVNPDNKEEVNWYYKFLDLLLPVQSVQFSLFNDNIVNYTSNIIFPLFNLFSNKNLAYSFIDYYVYNIFNKEELRKCVYVYAMKARQYYVSEEQYYSALMLLCNQVHNSKNKNAMDLIAQAIVRDSKMAGIYEIDEDAIRRLDFSVKRSQSEVSDVVTQLNKLKKKMNGVFDEVEMKINAIVVGKTRNIAALEESMRNMDSRVNSLVNDLEQQNEEMLKKSKEEIENLASFYLTKIDEKLSDNPSVIERFNQTDSRILNSSESFSEKLALARKNKKSNELYHESFDKILKQILLNKPVMLVGPSGCGKTYSVRQLGEVLGLRVYNFGFVSDEYAVIKGYNDASGQFVKTPFYEIFKNGGLAFFDEIDNSESKALIELNKITSADGYAPYLFPNGELVKPHPNFRLIAAGNTWGDGADPLYPTREKIDRATLNRFASIYYGYDESLEAKLLEDYPELFEFCKLYRQALIERQYEDIFSTKDMADIKDYLLSGEMSWEEIFSIKFIKNKRIEVLKSIFNYISEKNYTSIVKDFGKTINDYEMVRKL